MKIEKIIENKKQFLDLLLLADEQENMIDKYLPSGDLFAFYDDDLKSVCVVVPIDSESCGFEKSYRIENFFTDNYDHPMFEGDIQLVDMIYLKKDL